MHVTQARIQRGGPGVQTPLRFVRGGVLCGQGRGFNGYFYLIIIIFSGSLRSPVLYKYITCIHTSMINVQYGTVILSLHFSYPNNFPPLAFMKEHFHIILAWNYTILHHYSQKFSGGGPQTPFPYTFTIPNLPCHMCVL